MIQMDSRYFSNAHVMSDITLDPGVTTLYDGQWLCMKADGSGFILSTGVTNIKSYIAIGSKYGNPMNNIGLPITAPKNGRDTVTSTGMVSVLFGPFRLGTDQYETNTYVPGNALKVSANAKLDKWVQGTDKAEDIVAVVVKAPAGAGQFMTVVSA